MAKKITKTGKTIYKFTKKEMVQILADIAKIEDKELRLSLISKLGVQ
ncbi:hypothetical protein [Flavobacterium sp.]|nr:hypothetical protein [Flavobacterium sp.]